MGDPKKQRKKFSSPEHPWQKDRIETERALVREYGLKNKKEIWKMGSLMKNFFLQTKKLTATKSKQNEKEAIQLLNKLKSLGLLSESSDLSNILELSLKDILERRLQSVVFRKGLTKSMNQARQFIVHGHISLDGKKITSPSFIVSKEEEGLISFRENSSFVDEMHPERVQSETITKKTVKKKPVGKKVRTKNGKR